MINRRRFLQSSVSLLAGTGLGLLGMPRFSFAQGAAEKKLIVLFQRGGNDGLNTVIPYFEPLYYSMRPGIAIDPPDPGDPDAALPLTGNNQFGLHPALNTLWPIYEAGDLALFPAVHCGDNANRSHFYQWDFFDFGKHTSNTIPVLDGKGWVGRYLEGKYSSSAGIEAYNYDAGRYHLLDGPHPVLTISNPRSISLGAGSTITDPLVSNLLGTNTERNDTMTSLSGQWAQKQDTLFNNLARLDDLTFGENSASYPNTTLGRQFSDIATMLRGLDELEIVSLSTGGWDTHSNQYGAVGNHANRLKDVADSLSAFRVDMGASMDNIIVVVMTEFGRTVHENGSFGTDHGRASSWMVMGGKVISNVYGGYPGLGPEYLDNDNWLKPTVDYRDILAEALAFLGMSNPATTFPEYAYAPLNFIDHG